MANHQEALRRADRISEQKGERGNRMGLMCRRKAKFGSASAAYDVRKKMANQGLDVTTLRAFICNTCRFWHLGNPEEA